MQKKNYYLPDLENVQIGNDELASFDINNLSLEVLLLQSGYLTIKSSHVSGFSNTLRYTLGYPNFEVRQSWRFIERTLKMKKLPIGLSTLSEIRSDNHIYIDKTHHITNLIKQKYYFLSRPRRFGKSLLIDTLKQAFLGNKKLFEGLYLENNWDWNVKYKVIHFDFGEGVLRNRNELDQKIGKFLDYHYNMYNIDNLYSEVSSRFSYLIEQLSVTYGKVVLLIDEYDKPILDNITMIEIAQEMREGLKNLYGVIKTQDANLKFVMLTGVSKFSKVSLFSGLNNLLDITLDTRYADICGYNQTELEREFAEYFVAGNIDKAKLKSWYNGYNFAGTEEQKVYNPFDILLFISKGYVYRNYWFETATPTFLIKLFEKNQYYIPDLEEMVVGDRILSTFDVDNMPIVTLLFQTGYLTIKDIITRGNQVAYKLSYPNYEVKYSLNDSLAEIGSNPDTKEQLIDNMVNAIESNDFEKLRLVLDSHFAGIPNDWYRNNNIENYEGFYASIVYSYFNALGYDLIAEDVTNHCKIDLTIIMHDKILILEFKLSKFGSAEDAINQIKERNYSQKYLSRGMPIYLLGISFNSKERNIQDLRVEKLEE